MAAQINHAMPQKNVADRREVVSALRRFVELRSNWGWTQGAIYNQNLAFLKTETEGLGLARAESVQRRVEGYAEDAVGMDRLVMPNGEEQIFDLKFTMLKGMETDMYVRGGPLSLMWPSVALEGKSPAPVELSLFKGGKLGPMLERAGYSDHAAALNPVVLAEKVAEVESVAVEMQQANAK